MSFVFEDEACKIWQAEKMTDSPTTMASLLFLFLSHGCHGETDKGKVFIEEAAKMAKRMRLFGVSNALTSTDLEVHPGKDRQAIACAAWGAFGTIVYAR